VHKDWVGHPLKDFEAATGTRAAYLMRFGLGVLPTASAVIQEGDHVFMLVTDDIAAAVSAVSGSAPAA
jgi:trk system potassium uptake protein TrkA